MMETQAERDERKRNECYEERNQLREENERIREALEAATDHLWRIMWERLDWNESTIGDALKPYHEALEAPSHRKTQT